MNIMPNASPAIQAYRNTSRYRSQRDQEADVFRQAAAGLQRSRDATPVQKVRALADNRRLWTMVTDLMHDSTNALPEGTRSGIISVARAVQREMDLDAPDFDFLIGINEN